MMDDRELLTLAAKAAGIRHIQPHPDYSGELGLVVCDEHERPLLDWRPLTDDGDALRLAVRLGSVATLTLEIGNGGVCATFHHPEITTDEFRPMAGTYDPYAATRRAIVRAAAEIGRKL